MLKNKQSYYIIYIMKILKGKVKGLEKNENIFFNRIIMGKRIVSILLCVCLLLGACTKKTDVGIEEKVLPKDDMFELVANISGSQGIDSATSFRLTSKENIDKKYIDENLQFIPKREFKLEEVSSTVYNVIPLGKLEDDKVYQVKINSESNVYSWAFQTKKKFKVESTVPEDSSMYVPVTSGVEMYFSMKDLDKIDEYFEIAPHVEGKFIEKDNSIVFIPEQLDGNTKYTVTIKKGFGLKEGTAKLEEDYVFSFSTEGGYNSPIYFDRPLINIYEKNAKIIDAYIDDEYKEKEFNIGIYKYKDADSFAERVNSYAETGRFSSGITSDGNLSKINDIKQKPTILKVHYYGQALFQLPEELEKGYYLLEFAADGISQNQYLFLQVNDMLLYSADCSGKALVFASDGATGKGIKNAEVTVNDEQLGFTGEDGVLVAEKDITEYKTICMRIKAKGYNDFIYAESGYYRDYYYREMGNSNKYFKYLDTDRPVYLPTDKINIWGFARYRDNKSLNKLRVELEEYDTGLVLYDKYVDLTDIGTFQTEFELNNVTSDFYRIYVYDGDNIILSKYVQVNKYTKPLFRFEGEFDKAFVKKGESLKYKLKASFFDGYPMPDIKVRYSIRAGSYGVEQYDGYEASVSLGEEGEAEIDVSTDLRSDSWRPSTLSINCNNDGAEDKNVSIYDSIRIFPKDKMLEIESDNINKPQSFNILFHQMDVDRYDANNYYDFKYMRGKPLDSTINVQVIEKYYEKVKIGEEYDFINKVNQVRYEYKEVSNTVYSEDVTTENGIKNIEIPNFNKDRYYEVTAFYNGGEFGIKEQQYIGSRINDYDKPYYSFPQLSESGYRINDSVRLQLKYNDEDVSNTDNDNLLVMFMREGLIDYKISGDTGIQTEFTEDYIPNVMINAIYVKNGYIYPVEYYNSLMYRREERKMNINVEPDKEEYRPGEEVTLKITALDENNRPCIADVNISVVDEAYFAVFDKWVRTLEDIYDYIWNNGLRRSFMSNIDLSSRNVGGAEKGGGGGNDSAFRDEFKDTNVFKTVRTDKNGNATMKFKLADNLTSWRITYQGISDKQFAGSGTTNIRVSLPFYVDLIMGREYLKEDKITPSLRVFGNGLKKSEPVDYSITVQDKVSGKKTEYSAKGISGEYTNIPLNNLNVGEYYIYASASGSGKKDAIREEFSVVDSTVYFNNTSCYKISESTVFDQVYSNPVITLFNESSSDFYNSLREIAELGGRRIDQTVCSMIASKYINDNFNAGYYFNEEDLLYEIAKYEEKGGIKLFPYSGADAEVSAKLLSLVDRDYLKSKLGIYFKNLLKSEEYNRDVAPSLWGLSMNREPVLLTIYGLLEKDDLEYRDRVYLLLALAELGDIQTAKKYYKELIEGKLKEDGAYLYFDNSAEQTVNITMDGNMSAKQVDIDEKDQQNRAYDLTALISVLAAKLQDFENGDRLFKYIYNNPSKYMLSSFEQLIYIMNRDIMKLDEIKDLFGEVTVSTDGTKKTYKLNLFDRESFAVTKDKIKDIKFSNIKGDIACKVDALGNKDDLDKNKSDDMSLKISYKLRNSSAEQSTYKHSDTVKVTITPSFSANVEAGSYEITYVVPSGFRYVDAEGINGVYAEEDGQKLKFYFHYDKKVSIIPISFYMQAAQTGEYTVDYVVIKEAWENKLNYLDKMKLTVQ